MRGTATACVTGFFVAIATPAFAEVVDFRASVDRERVEAGRTLVLTVSVTVSDHDSVSGLMLPRPDDFEVVSTGRNVRTQVTIDRGGRRHEKTVEHTMVLRALSVGRGTIPPAVMDYRGRTYRTDSIHVEVVPAGRPERREERRTARPRTPRSLSDLLDPQRDPFDAFEDIQRHLESELLGEGVLRGRQDAQADVFVDVTVDEDEVWLGEQVTAEIVIYSRQDLGGFPTPPGMPQMEGFWQEDLERPTQIRPRIRHIDGQPYRAYLLRRLALFPTRSGELVIDPVKVEVETAMGLLGRGRTIKRESEPVAISVRPLPAEGRPEGFASTNVGSWRMKASLGRASTVEGEPVTLTVSITGEGNVNAIEPPDLLEQDGLRIHAPSISRRPSKRGDRYGGTKEVSWVIMPRREGSFTIAPMELHFFDPSAGGYRVTSTRPLLLEVDAADTPAPGTVSREEAGDGAARRGFRTIRYGVAPSIAATPAHRSPVLIGAVGLSILLLFVLALIDAARRGMERRSATGKARRAPSVARAGLRSAGKLARSGDGRAAAAMVQDVFCEYLDTVMEERVRGLARGSLRHELEAAGCPGTLAEQVCDLLERCETVRYAPVAAGESDTESLIESAGVILERLAAAGPRGGGA